MYFKYLEPANVYPKGWLLKQLQIQAEGLHGNLDKIWPDIRDSKWLGGDREGWERLPYFMDGFIPLAYLLRDEDMIARAQKYMDILFTCQEPDGCFYPKGDEEKKNGDIWSLFLICKLLTVHEQFTHDERVEESLYRCLKFLNKYLDHNPPAYWAATRWYECIIPIVWLYERRKEEWLIRLARRLKVHGTDFETAMMLWDETGDDWRFETHVVNIAMALKAEAIYCEATGDKRTGLAERMLEKLFTYHGTAYNHFNGDECLSSHSPVQGSELCGVVEAMYSYEWLTMLTGDAKWGDLLESLAFNALPASVSEDMWSHQYDQQVNQIACTDFEHPIFRTNGPQSNMFGLEPHFGCCTSNFGQGWPKFAWSAYLDAGDALAIVSPVPAEIDYNGAHVVIASQYPFRSAFTLTADKDVKILLRKPSWARVTATEKMKIKNGWISFTARAGVSVRLTMEGEIKLCARPEERFCLKYGNLLFALPVACEKKMFEYERDGVPRKFPYCDWQFLPTGEWRYAFTDSTYELAEHDFDNAFSRSNPPLTIEATFAPVEWDYEEGHELVASRKAGNVRRGENVTLKMQPYGATDLRVTEMAKIK